MKRKSYMITKCNLNKLSSNTSYPTQVQNILHIKTSSLLIGVLWHYTTHTASYTQQLINGKIQNSIMLTYTGYFATSWNIKHSLSNTNLKKTSNIKKTLACT